MSTLHARLDRLAARDALGGRSVAEAAWQFHALCEGLAAAELRDPGVGRDPEGRWRAALDALVRGFAVAPVASENGRAGGPGGRVTRRGPDRRGSRLTSAGC